MPRQSLRPEAGDSAQETVGKQMPRHRCGWPAGEWPALVIPHHDPASRVGVVAPGVLHVLGGACAIEDRLVVDLLDAERHLPAHPFNDAAHLPRALVTARLSAMAARMCAHMT